MNSRSLAMSESTTSRPTSHDAAIRDRASISPAELEALFQQYYARVYAVLYRLVGDEADDLAQEVFLRLYYQLPKRDDPSLAAWLYRVATNLGYNALRAQRRRRKYGELHARLDEDAGWLQAETAPEAHVERLAEQQAVRQALAQLRKRDARLLALRYSGLSYREIAEALQVSDKSVGALLARAERAFERVYERLLERQQSKGGEP